MINMERKLFVQRTLASLEWSEELKMRSFFGTAPKDKTKNVLHGYCTMGSSTALLIQGAHHCAHM